MKCDEIWFVYDGECPVCCLGASFYKIRQSVGTLHVVDARCGEKHPVVAEINAAGLNLDDGMVIKYRNRLYHGADALQLMATLGGVDGLLNKVNNFLFQSRSVANASYPFMKAVRNLALWLKGVGKIGNLKH